MRKILKRLGMLMLISVSCMSQSVQIPLHAQTMLGAPATREEVKISPTDVIRKGFKVRVETPKGLHDDYENKWVIKMSEKSSSGYDSCVYSKIWIDDQRVYCVDPLTSVMDGAQDYEQISFGAYVNDAAVREKLSYITALGYGFQGDTSHEMDFATQICIWQTLHEWKPRQYPAISYIHKDIQSKIALIKARLALMEEEVSFAGEQLQLQGLGEEHAVTLQDDGGSFQWYVLSESSDGLHVRQDGNSLQIWAERIVTDGKLTFSCLYEDAAQIIPVVFDSPGSQDVMTLGRPRPKLAEITVDVQSEARFRKLDAGSGTFLSGAQLRIYPQDNPDQILAEWMSGDEAKVIKGLPIERKLILEETKAPYGFARSEKIIFALDDTGAIWIYDEEGDPHAAKEGMVTMEDELIKGRLSWQKTGSLYQRNQIRESEFGMVYTPIWEKGNLPGAQITVYAAEDIVLGNDRLYYSEDEQITVLESGNDPVQSLELPCGSYYYVETKAPAGHVADHEKHFFEIQADEDTQLQIVPALLHNEPIRVRLQFRKQMEAPRYSEMNDALEQVRFGIFAASDICFSNGDVGVPKGTLVSVCKVDEEGALSGVPDLPQGDYVLRELATDERYQLLDEEYPFTVSDVADDAGEIIISLGEAVNALKRGSVEVIKHDAEDDRLLQGAVFVLCTDEGLKNEIMERKSGADGKVVFDDLEYGDYWIVEKRAPYGYVQDQKPYHVKIGEDHAQLRIHVDNEAILTDLKVQKVDSLSHALIKDSSFVFGLYADKDGETLLMKAQGDEGIATFSGLRYGTYYLKELQAPEGYSSSAKMRKIVLDEKTRGISDTVTISVGNKRNVVTGTGHCAGQIAVVLACALGALLWLRRTMKEN